MDLEYVWLFCLCAIQLLSDTLVAASPNLYCGACEALVDEIDYAISSADQNQVLEVGSFRIDPQGQQKREKIKFAGSETHLHEIIDEDICSTMEDYALTIGDMTGETVEEQRYVRYNSRGEHKHRVVDNVILSPHVSKGLSVACGNILDDYEDEIIDAFVKSKEDIKEFICQEITGYCVDKTSSKDEL